MKSAHLKILGLAILLALALNSILAETSSNFSNTWNCTSGLAGCEKYWVCSDQAKTDCSSCGYARPLYYAGNYMFTDLYFNVSQTGNYSCSLNITETGYGYYNGPQTREYVGVYLNNIFLGNSTDHDCNTGTHCKSCFVGTSNFTRNLTLNSLNNHVYLVSFSSHALKSVSISCRPIVPSCTPTTEICDGLDNDCDGLIDEDLINSTNELGICSNNNQICQNGKWVDNSSNIKPRNETCNGLDDNVNGLIDENLNKSTGQLGLCSNNSEFCSNGHWVNDSKNILPKPEECNNLDDNCNGQVDEGLGTKDFIFRNYFCYDNSHVWKNITYLECEDGDWEFKLNQTYNNTCDLSIILVDKYCVEKDLTFNWSVPNDPACFLGSCGRHYEQNSTRCDFDCVDDECVDQCYEDSDCPMDTISAPFCKNEDVYHINYDNYCSQSKRCETHQSDQLVEDCGEDSVVEGEQYCSGDSLVKNLTTHDKGCSDNSCFHNSHTDVITIEECEYGCSNDECNPVPDWPSCSVDYLEGDHNFNLTNGSIYLNEEGFYSVHGYASSNSENFTLKQVGFNRTSPDYKIRSWDPAGRSILDDFYWKTNSNSDDTLFVDGTHTVCCRATSQKCDNPDDCEVRVGNASCTDFCIDTEDPEIEIEEVDNMDNWNSTSFNWHFEVSDEGCAGIERYSVNLSELEGDTIYYSANSNLSSLLSENLKNGSTYKLEIEAIDKAGNSEIDSALLYVNISSPKNETNETNKTAPIVHIISPINEHSYYNITSVLLNVSADQAISSWKYSLDYSNNESFVPGIYLNNLTNGTHFIQVYGTNENGTGTDYATFYITMPKDKEKKHEDCNLCSGEPVYYSYEPISTGLLEYNYTESVIDLSKAKEERSFNYFYVIPIILMILIFLLIIIVVVLLVKRM